MRAVRSRRAGVLPLLVLLAACGGSPTGEQATSSPVAGAPTLRGSVGTQASADAFEIALVDADGKPVDELPAGQYNVEVTDFSGVHDFHLRQLSGGGKLDERTGVTETGTTTWGVTLAPGDYRYMCDPHPSMNGHFTVR